MTKIVSLIAAAIVMTPAIIATVAQAAQIVA